MDEDTLDAVLDAIRTTPPLSRCGIKDVSGEQGLADVRLGLPTPNDQSVYDLFVACQEAAESLSNETVTVSVGDEHQIDEFGEPYFYVTVRER